MGILEERLAFLGLDTDTELRSIPNGSYLLPSLNIRINATGENQQGIVTNIKGNTLVSFALPSGVNKHIGSFSDKQTGNVYYFLHNSLGNHGIFRFRQPDIIETIFISSLLNFSTDHLITHANLVDEKLLYWTDGLNPPRKINVEKALEGKQRTYNIYFGTNSGTGETYTFTIRDPNGVSVFSWNVTVPNPFPALADAFYAAHYIVANLPAGVPATLIQEGGHIQLTMSNVGEYTFEATCVAANQVMTVAENFYPKPYVEDFIDRLKYPFHCEPDVSYKHDPDRNVNLIKEKVFQFATQYVYDDNEFSSLSPFSAIPDYGSPCVQAFSQNALNFIEVNFTEDRLNDVSVRSIIKYVNVYFREHNDGKWKQIQTLTPEEFGIGTQIINFYNDGLYRVISDELATTLFSTVPLTCVTEFIGKKLVDSDIVEGYNPVNVDAELSIVYNARPPRGFTIKGRLFLNSLGDVTTGYPKQPIYNLSNPPSNVNAQTNAWGGIMSDFGNPFTLASGNGIKDASYSYQNAPLYGFVFFLRGTDFYGVTKQNATGLSFQNGDTGVLNISDEPSFLATWQYMRNTGFSHDWRIEDIPPGLYSLAIASHLTTGSDLLTGTRRWQKTSTTIAQAGNNNATAPAANGVAGSGNTEVIVQILSNGTIYVRNPITMALLYTAPADGTLSDSCVADVTHEERTNIGSNVLKASLAVMGYITDDEGTGVPTSITNMLGNERVTRTRVNVRKTSLTISGGTPQVIDTEVSSDHNGFFWSNHSRHGGISASGMVSIEILNYTNYLVTSGSTLPLYDINNIASSFYIVQMATVSDMNYARMGVASYNNVAFTQQGRTIIKGRVISSLLPLVPVANFNVVIPFHSTAPTDINGAFKISFYKNPYNNGGMVFASGTDGCIFTVATTGFLLPALPWNTSPPAAGLYLLNPIPIGNGITDFNDKPAPNTRHVSVPDFLVVLLFGLAANKLKRGGDYQYGLVYYDRGLRSNTVSRNEKLDLHINFYTEPGIDASGNPFLHPTGEPDVSWLIRHLPPVFFIDALGVKHHPTHWQWVRTKNLQLNWYLEWLADTVRYTDKPEQAAATVSYSSGVYLAIKLDNITTYYNEHAASQIAYNYTQGDRIRFIIASDNSMYTTYIDKEIVAYSNTANEIYIQNEVGMPEFFEGTFFEIYSPRPDIENKIFFECGECYEVRISSGGIPYHATDSLANNQDPNDPYNTPATGTFKTGDAWYRNRRIPYTTSVPQHKIEFVDDASINDFYKSDDSSIGRINILNLDYGQLRRLKTLRWSGDFIDNLKVNNLSWNLANDTTDILKGEGSVNKLQVAGRVLLAIQAGQVNSVYIYESQFIDATGNVNVIKGDGFIGSINPLKLLSGTIHPESVQEYQGRVYYFDELKGQVIRYSDDGQTEISDAGMVSYFKNLSKFFSGRAYGFIDPKNLEYGITFIPYNKSNVGRKTIVFCDQEGKRRWTSEYSFLPEGYGISNMEIVMFKDGELWVGERNDIRNNFFGTQYNSRITLVSNENNSKQRTFIALVVDGSDVWHAPNDDDITIPPSVKYPQGMKSRLLKNLFRRIGTDWYTPFKKDLNSPNKTPQEAISNGRDLMGHVIKITLQNDSTEEVTLKSCGVRYLIDEFTKK